MKRITDFPLGRNLVNDDLETIQSQLDELSALASIQGPYVVSGCLITKPTPSVMNISAGVVMLNGVLHRFDAVTNVSILTQWFIAPDVPQDADYRPYTLASIVKPGAKEYVARLVGPTAPSGESLTVYSFDLQVRRISHAYRDLTELPNSIRPVFANPVLDGLGFCTGVYRGYVPCNGQLGTPDLRGRTIVGTGDYTAIDADDLTKTYALGEVVGRNTVKLAADESGVPAHTHGVKKAAPGSGASNTDTLSQNPPSLTLFGDTEENTPADAAASHENRQPSLALQYIMYTSTRYMYSL